MGIMLIAALFSDSALSAEFEQTRYYFSAAWFLTLGLSVLVAARTALWEWYVKAGPRVGDLITTTSTIDRLYVFLALVAFTFFDVEKQVRDIVIMLHPWKSVQPYAAFKCEGHRAYIVGYMDEYMFRLENRTGQWSVLPFNILTRTIIFALKLYMVLTHVMSDSKDQMSYTLVVSTLSSVATV